MQGQLLIFCTSILPHFGGLWKVKHAFQVHKKDSRSFGDCYTIEQKAVRGGTFGKDLPQLQTRARALDVGARTRIHSLIAVHLIRYSCRLC